MLRNSRITLNT